MRSHAAPVVASFREALESVERLARFDELVLSAALVQLRNLQVRLSALSENPRHHVSKTIDHLENIQGHDSLKGQYAEIYNQCVVLQVSYFSSAASDLFRRVVPHALANSTSETAVFKEELKFSLEELYGLGSEVFTEIGDLILKKQDISFQDMQSTNRALKRYLGIEMQRGEVINNIICGQACRHAIVHAGGVADKRLIHQLRGAMPRSLKPSISEGEKLTFSPDEISLLGKEMLKYLEGAVQQLPDAA